MNHVQARPDLEPATVLARATLRAADLLGVRQARLAAILGISEASVSRLVAGKRGIEPASKEGELALLFVRAFRSLDALFGGHAEPCRAWFDAINGHLGGVPRDLVASVQGLVDVTHYLDAMRGKM